MCGIAGYLDLRSRGRVQPEVLARMGDALVHRGPDSDGLFHTPDFGVAFRRLKIVDLTSGEQPISNEDGSLVMVCNGEIFNYPELHAWLLERGHRFKTRSDVEVVLHLYEEIGDNCAARLNGQFAFVIFDLARRRALMARDHFGVNPFFYSEVDGLLLFGSEIKGLLRHPEAPRRADLVGLDQVLAMPGLVSPRTMFAGIRSLPAGHQLVVENGEVRVREFWDLNYPAAGAETLRDEQEVVEQLSALFEQSVRRRLQSDVPVGLFISGGLDSTLVTSWVAAEHRFRPLKAFSVTFDDPGLDEARHQRLVAERFELELHETLIDWSLISDRMRQMILHCECAVKESFNTCILALAECAKANGISVVLAGQGADELFGGYVGYRFDSLGPRQSGLLDEVEQAMEEELRLQLWGDAALFYEKDHSLFRETRMALYSPAVQANFAEIDCLGHPLVNTARVVGRHPLHQRSYLDLKLRLADHLLSDHGDRMVMAHAVEARYPFLDVDLVEYASRIPAELKIKGTTEKYLVRRIAAGRIPDEILGREKFGFYSEGSPLLLRQKLDWVEELLSPERLRRQGVFDVEVVERLKRQYLREDFHLHPHLETDYLMVVLTFGLLSELYSLTGHG